MRHFLWVFCCSAIQERVKKFQNSKSGEKVPGGLKIHRVTAKGRNIQPLQERFDVILKEAKFKRIDATIKALIYDKQLYRDLCTTEKNNLEAAIQAWRNSFQARETNLDMDADHFVASAKCFANDFYFQCIAIRTLRRKLIKFIKTNKMADLLIPVICPQIRERKFRQYEIYRDEFSDEELRSRYRFGRDSMEFLTEILENDL